MKSIPILFIPIPLIQHMPIKPRRPTLLGITQKIKCERSEPSDAQCICEAKTQLTMPNAGVIRRKTVKLVCWWFGCDPDCDHSCGLSPNYVVPCKRCGAQDTHYDDRLGDTRHNRFMQQLRYWCWRRWWPVPCGDCGKRFGEHSDCCPF